MSDTPIIQTNLPTTPQQNGSSTLSARETQELSMMMSKYVAESPKLTSSQITSIIRQREKAMDYQHADTQKILDIQKDEPKHHKHILIGFCVFFLLTIIIVGSFDKTYIGDILKIMFSFVGGGGLGYAYAKKEKANKSD